MYRTKYKKLIATMALIVALNITLTGCRDNKVENKNNEENTNYNEEEKEIYESTGNSSRALHLLQEKYGEEFEVVQEGGTFGTGSDSRRFICNPVKDKNVLVQVQLMSDMITIQDDYINRIIEQKLANILEEKGREIFKSEVEVRLLLDSIKTEYTSLDMDPVKYFKNNKKYSYVMDVFIKSDGNINNDRQAQNILDFTNYILDLGVENDNFIDFWYCKDEIFTNVDNIFYHKALNSQVSDYYRSENRTYSNGIAEITNNEIVGSIDDIKISLEKEW